MLLLQLVWWLLWGFTLTVTNTWSALKLHSTDMVLRYIGYYESLSTPCGFRVYIDTPPSLRGLNGKTLTCHIGSSVSFFTVELLTFGFRTRWFKLSKHRHTLEIDGRGLSCDHPCG